MLIRSLYVLTLFINACGPGPGDDDDSPGFRSAADEGDRASGDLTTLEIHVDWDAPVVDASSERETSDGSLILPDVGTSEVF